MDKIKLEVGEISLIEEGILKIVITKEEEILISDIENYLEAVNIAGKGKLFCNMIVVNHYVTIDSATRKFMASKKCLSHTVADAFVVNSIALKIIGNFYIQMDKPARPTKIFNNENDAFVWLKSQWKKRKNS
jgi:hypothetical protein